MRRPLALTNISPSYPKHVWSPAGGWYSQPANWKANTAVMGAVIAGITLMAWSVSADREHRHNMPEVRIPRSSILRRGENEWRGTVLTRCVARSILPFEILEPTDH